MQRVLVTGAGGAAAVAFVQAVDHPLFELFAGDIDPYAAGLYQVPADRRLILLPGKDPQFADHLLTLCREHAIDVLVPTVDVELLPLAHRRKDFEAAGIRMLLASGASLATCLDKFALARACESRVPTPRTELFDASFDPRSWSFPVIVKPRTGSGSRGVTRVDRLEELERLPRSDRWIVQQFLPGAEYSVDVLSIPGQSFFAAVARERLKVDSGVAVAGRTVRDPQLEELARSVVDLVGLDYVANIQFRRDEQGTPYLLEVNPRFPGTMPLSVAAGINMPRISLGACLGHRIPEDFQPEIKEIAMVRTWEETFVACDDVSALEALRP